MLLQKAAAALEERNLKRLQWIVLNSRFMLEPANFGIISFAGSISDKVGQMNTGTLKVHHRHRHSPSRGHDPVSGRRPIEVSLPFSRFRAIKCLSAHWHDDRSATN